MLEPTVVGMQLHTKFLNIDTLDRSYWLMGYYLHGTCPVRNNCKLISDISYLFLHSYVREFTFEFCLCVGINVSVLLKRKAK